MTKEKNLIERLIEIQAEVEDPIKDANNPFFKNKYASLDSFLPELRKLCAKHGVFLTQCVANKGNGEAELITRVSDGASSVELANFPINVSKKPQETGSEITYARRYSLMPAFGLIGDEDDDGNTCSGNVPSKRSTSQNRVQKPTQQKRYEHDTSRLTEMKEDLAEKSGRSQAEIGEAFMKFADKPLFEMGEQEYKAFIAQVEDFYRGEVNKLKSSGE